MADWTMQELLDATRDALVPFSNGISLQRLRVDENDPATLICELTVRGPADTSRWRLTLSEALGNLQIASLDSAGLIVAANIDEWLHTRTADPHPTHRGVRVA